VTDPNRAAERDGTDVLLQRLREYSLILYDNPSRRTVSEAEEWRTDAVAALVEAVQWIAANSAEPHAQAIADDALKRLA
jgi:hypothetical protein